MFNFKAAMQFQSTLPYGSDLFAGYLLFARLYFNPRSLTGATYIIKY